jgi:predicted nucleic acid-binding protein
MSAAPTFIDTNILLDLATRDPQWLAWSLRQVEVASLSGRLVIDPVVYAELSVRFSTLEMIDAFLLRAEIVMEPTPREALFLAGKVYRNYRGAGGVKTGVLPDFLIGAHAAVVDAPLLTRDVGRYRTYFPTLHLIAP